MGVFRAESSDLSHMGVYTGMGITLVWVLLRAIMVSPLKRGDGVRIQPVKVKKELESATVAKVLPYRLYEVRTPDGRDLPGLLQHEKSLVAFENVIVTWDPGSGFIARIRLI